MDRQLMEKEVLCILDTRQIQKYMFRSTSFEDALGGSDIMTHILEDGILYALQNADPPLDEDSYDLSIDPEGPVPFFENSGILFQMMMCAAGNAMFLVRTGRLAQQIIRKVSRYYLDHAYSLNLAAAAVEKTDSMSRDINELFNKLDKVKASAAISDPLDALPVVLREKITGAPVIGWDERNGDYISRASFLRRQEAALRGEIISLKDVCSTKGVDGQRYKAVIHVDGNNLGITIGRILQKTPDYRKGIRIRREINQNIKDLYGRIMAETVAELKSYYESLGCRNSDFDHEFQVIHNSGDDINCMCNADMAFPFLDLLFRKLRGTYIGESDGKRIPLCCCAGICFVTEKTSFHSAFMMAEECCGNAKKTAKLEQNLRDGLAGNWIDFQICERPYFQELDLLRERAFFTDSNVNLSLRPYCLDDEAKDSECAYGKFMDRVKNLHRLEKKFGRKNMNRLRESYLLGNLLFAEEVRLLKDRGTDLEEMLGTPFYRDENRNTYATWYDALQVLPFIPEAGPGREDDSK